MDIYLPIGVSIVTLIVSVAFAYWRTRRSNSIARGANDLANEANKKAELANKLSHKANKLAESALEFQRKTYEAEQENEIFPGWVQEDGSIVFYVVASSPVYDVEIEFRHYNGTGGKIRLTALETGEHRFPWSEFLEKSDLERAESLTTFRAQASWTNANDSSRKSSGVYECTKSRRKFQKLPSTA